MSDPQSDPKWPRSILIYSSSAAGGMPHYAHYQAQELARRGIAVTMLCRPDHPWAASPTRYTMLRGLPVPPVGRGLVAKALRVWCHIWGHFVLLGAIMQMRPSAVLFEENTEYFAAIWAWPHILLSWLGLPYIINLHDPVRALWFGPRWFGRLSLWAAYRVLKGGLIHGEPPAGAYLPRWMVTEIVPHGLFGHMAEREPPFDLRERLGIAPDAFVLLSFGHITDRKNQHLLVEAMAQVPGAVLVIAGPQPSTRQRGAAFYRQQAAALGCADRVHVIDRFIPDDEAAACFAAADAAALTYDRTFVSQSGVLQLAAQWNRPVLASGGDGPLRAAVEGSGIGIFVEPDSTAAIVSGLQSLMASPPPDPARFAAFRESASWEANVDGMLRLLRRVKGLG